MENINKPKIKIGISLFTDKEATKMMEEITRLLEISPTSCSLNGEPRLNAKNAYHTCSTWSYTTDYVYSFHLEDVVNMFLNIFEDKVNSINFLKGKYQMDAFIDVCIVFADEEIPSMLLDRSFINFANNIDASIDIDCYKK